LLTPGITTPNDPPPILSGMVGLTLDSQGRLAGFEAIPPQERETAGKPAPPPDWNALFRAAGLDPAQFQPAAPIRTWLASSDTRMAWTGSWPGSKWPLRVEAAALQGKPVAFALIGPWTKPDRMPPPESVNSEMVSLAILGCITLAVFVGGPLLARRNLAAGKGDRRGAFRLAAFIFCAQIALWLTRSHFALSMDTFGMFLLAVCTASFYGITLWTVYLALEPYVRRYWPRTIISWTRVLSGQFRDPIVGRDVLFGVALGVVWSLIDRLTSLWSERTGPSLGLFDTDLLLGPRHALGAWLQSVPHGVREALVFFFILFLLRLLLRNQWLGGAAFVLLWTTVQTLGSSDPVLFAVVSAVAFIFAVAVVLRFGLLALSIGVFAAGLLARTPTLQPSAWYFANANFMLLSVVALAAWAFSASIAGRRGAGTL
jgi:hypothetical protein